jgi:hypothetical protein
MENLAPSWASLSHCAVRSPIELATNSTKCIEKSTLLPHPLLLVLTSWPSEFAFYEKMMEGLLSPRFLRGSRNESIIRAGTEEAPLTSRVGAHALHLLCAFLPYCSLAYISQPPWPRADHVMGSAQWNGGGVLDAALSLTLRTLLGYFSCTPLPARRRESSWDQQCSRCRVIHRKQGLHGTLPTPTHPILTNPCPYHKGRTCDKLAFWV